MNEESYRCRKPRSCKENWQSLPDNPGRGSSSVSLPIPSGPRRAVACHGADAILLVEHEPKQGTAGIALPLGDEGQRLRRNFAKTVRHSQSRAYQPIRYVAAGGRTSALHSEPTCQLRVNAEEGPTAIAVVPRRCCRSRCAVRSEPLTRHLIELSINGHPTNA